MNLSTSQIVFVENKGQQIYKQTRLVKTVVIGQTIRENSDSYLLELVIGYGEQDIGHASKLRNWFFVRSFMLKSRFRGVIDTVF